MSYQERYTYISGCYHIRKYTPTLMDNCLVSISAGWCLQRIQNTRYVGKVRLLHVAQLLYTRNQLYTV